MKIILAERITFLLGSKTMKIIFPVPLKPLAALREPLER
jgi:hypothetical protein